MQGQGKACVFIKRIEQKHICCKDQGTVFVKPRDDLQNLVSKLLSPLIPERITGLNILVKPNLLKVKESLCTTSAPIIIAAATVLKEKGASVTVADSPAFGRALQVLKSMGIYDILRSMDVEMADLSNPVKKLLPCGLKVSVSKMALDADLIVNLPRLKAHCQTGVTGAVKNLYGTVPGFRKALYHMTRGRNISLFSRMIIEIGMLLPKQITIMDCSTVMHETGPTGGKPLWLGIIASSVSAHATDTAMYNMINASPESIPIWKEARRMGISHAFCENIDYPLLSPKDVTKGRDFKLPERLDPITFNPIRFVMGRIKSVVRKIAR